MVFQRSCCSIIATALLLLVGADSFLTAAFLPTTAAQQRPQSLSLHLYQSSIPQQQQRQQQNAADSLLLSASSSGSSSSNNDMSSIISTSINNTNNNNNNNNQEASSWINRPLRRHNDERDTPALEKLDRTEIFIGRLAMLGSVLLLTQEVLTGESIQELVAEFWRSCVVLVHG